MLNAKNPLNCSDIQHLIQIEKEINIELAKESDNQKLLKLMEVHKLYKFEGKFSNMGIKKAYEGRRGSYDERSFYKPYILLTEVSCISCRGIIVADELYLIYSKSFRKLGELYVGDIVSFNGKVISYFKKMVMM